MSFNTIDREMGLLLSNGALRKLVSSDLLKTQNRFKGKVVVITGQSVSLWILRKLLTSSYAGAGSGLGRAYAVHAAQNGARVVIGDVNQEGLDETMKLIAAVRGYVLLATSTLGFIQLIFSP